MDVGGSDIDKGFRDELTYDAAEYITAYLDQREQGIGGALPTTGFAEQMWAGRGIAPTMGQVDLARTILSDVGVPLGRGARAFLDDNLWVVRNRDGSVERLVDWDKRVKKR